MESAPSSSVPLALDSGASERYSPAVFSASDRLTAYMPVDDEAMVAGSQGRELTETDVGS